VGESRRALYLETVLPVALSEARQRGMAGERGLEGTRGVVESKGHTTWGDLLPTF